MNIKILIVTFITSLSVFQPLSANETCGAITVEEINQFVADHTTDWQTLLTAQLFLSSNTEEIIFEKGFPLQVYTITPESLQNYATQGSFKSTLVSKNTWYIPISSASTYDLLEIHCFDNELEITGIAGSRIAEQLNKVSTQLQEQIDLGEVSQLIVRIETTSRLFLTLEKNGMTTIYPLIEFPSQYSSLQPVDDLNGYSASDVLLVIAAEFLNIATLTPEFNIVIPKTAYTPPTATGPTDMLWISLEYLPNDEDKLLFEVNDYYPLP